MPGDLISRPLIEIARELRERRATARELVEAAIARHARFGERLHTYSFWAPEQARAVAQAADAAFSAGVSAGPLQGLPVSIKDLFAAAGYPCFAGSSRRLPADPWERDGPLVATLRRQLGVIMGKTHMVEFAFGGTGRNTHHGAPSNPWDPAAQRSVGGSSSGAGVIASAKARGNQSLLPAIARAAVPDILAKLRREIFAFLICFLAKNSYIPTCLASRPSRAFSQRDKTIDRTTSEDLVRATRPSHLDAFDISATPHTEM